MSIAGFLSDYPVGSFIFHLLPYHIYGATLVFCYVRRVSSRDRLPFLRLLFRSSGLLPHKAHILRVCRRKIAYLRSVSSEPRKVCRLGRGNLEPSAKQSYSLKGQLRMTCRTSPFEILSPTTCELDTLVLKLSCSIFLRVRPPRILRCHCANMNLAQREQNEDQEAFLPKARDGHDSSFTEGEEQGLLQSLKAHLRLVVEIFMALLIFVLLVHPSSRATMKPSAVPTCMALPQSHS